MPTRTGADAPPLFELKFGQVGIARLRVFGCDDIPALRAQIDQAVRHSPALSARAPVILDFGGLQTLPDNQTARELLAAVRSAGMLPVGLPDISAENESLALSLGLPLFPKPRRSTDKSVPHSEPTATVVGMHREKMVRSGQQVYARGRDLVVAASVGNGAEVIADGSIHIYGRLSGRALAGVQGDVEARIYCSDFRAELVSIAGRYRVFEELPADLRGQSVQIWLDGEKLELARL